MNTKGIKFLAVLAVMVMAFAAIVVLAPADNDVVAEDVYGYADAQKDPTVITAALTAASGGYNKFYISEDAAVKVTGLGQAITIYVQNGVELELNIKPAGTATKLDYTITVLSVTGDQQKITTSTVYTGGENGTKTGKIVITNTEFTFTGVKGQTVTYEAMMPYMVDTHTTTTSGKKVVISNVYTKDSNVTPSKQYFAIISSDASLASPVIKEFVTIASGQNIEVTGTAPADFTAYGIKVQDYTAATTSTPATTTYTYFAIGADAGSFNMDNSNDAVDVKNGTISVNNGDSMAAAKAVKGVAVGYSAAGTISISTNGGTDKDTMTAGTLTVSGTIAFSSAIVGSSATVSVSNNTTLTGTIKVDGKLNLRNNAGGISGLTVTGEGTIVALNEKLWDYGSSVDPVLTFTNSAGFTGQFDVSAITKVAEVKDAFSTALIKKNQTFRVVADTVVTTALDIEGVLIIEPGVTLTISKINSIGATVSTLGQYAQIINNGEILIKTTKQSGTSGTMYSGLDINSGYFENNGRIIASSDADTNPTSGSYTTVTLCVKFEDVTKDTVVYKGYGTGFINNGSITLSQNDNISLDDNFTNGSKGSLSVNGKFAASNFKNKGAFTLTNAKVNGNLTVNLSTGATFNLVAAELASGAYIEAKDTSSIKVTANGAVTVRGMTVADTGDKYNGRLDLSGSMGITKAGTSSGYATLTIDKEITVNDVATIGEGYLLDIDTAVLTVPGYLTIMKKGTAIPEAEDDTINGLKLKSVTGEITDTENRLNLSTNYVAAKYSLPSGTAVYTSLEAAVPAAVEANVSLINVGEIPASGSGSTATPAVYPTVTSDVVIPEGIFVSGTGLTVGSTLSAPTIMIESSAGFSFTSIKLVDGMIVAENANDINAESVAADVKIIDSETYSAKFMSLGVALLLADEGDVIELSQDFEMISDDLVIPKGIVVDATAADTDKYFTLIDSNLVVNGTLIVNEFWFIATTDDTKSITVNGTIMDYHSDGRCLTDKWYTPLGVSYKLTIPDETGDEHTWFVITSLENIQPAIEIADDSKVNVEGDVVLDELTIYGTEDQPAEVTFKGDVSIDELNIDHMTLIFQNGNEINATIKNAVGSITLTGAYVDTYLSIFTMDIYSSEDAGVYMEGAVTDSSDGTYGILFEGITGMDGSDVRTAINYGNYLDESEEVADTPTIIFAGETTIIGKRVYINSDDEQDVHAMATITGVVYVFNGSKLIMNCDAQIVGALVAMERTEDAVAGSIEANGKIFVGMLESDIYDYTAVFTAAEAIFSGKVALGSDVLIYVSPDATVDPTIVEDLDTLDIYVDDEVWFSVYAYATKTFGLDYLAVPMFNSAISEIKDAKLTPINYEIDGNVILQTDSDKTFSQYGGAIYIGLDYYIFEVKIKTDGSVKAVYIDGILMETGESKNIFIMKNVAAGTYKVTVEAATGYDADKCKLYTEMGTILPNMGFTFTELDVTEYDYEMVGELLPVKKIPVVVYNISGTEIQPEPVPPTPEEESQWTVTTILLVILVVLIAIMAVIVALRLNRS